MHERLCDGQKSISATAVGVGFTINAGPKFDLTDAMFTCIK